MQETAFTTIEAWSRIHHPGIVSVREAFTTRAFNDNCKFLKCMLFSFPFTDLLALVVVYDYHPNAQTIFDVHLKPKVAFNGGRLHHERINEPTLWSYIFQIASAIKCVHEQGMAVRMIDASKILITSQNRYVSHLCQ